MDGAEWLLWSCGYAVCESGKQKHVFVLIQAPDLSSGRGRANDHEDVSLFFLLNLKNMITIYSL